MGNEVTNAPAPPAKDPLTPGVRTSEFMLTGAGLFLSTLLALLAAFNVLHLTPEQKQSIYEFTAASWAVLPAVYSFARAYVKAKAVQQKE